MLSDSSKQVIRDRVAAMPERVREALEHIDTAKYLSVLASKYNLRTDEAQTLENEIMIVMLGLEKPEAFIHHLTKAGISKETAAGLVADVNRDVFEKIRHDLMEFLQKTGAGTDEDIDMSESPISKLEREEAEQEKAESSEPAPAVIMPKVEEITPTHTEATPPVESVAPTEQSAPASASVASTPTQNQSQTTPAPTLANDFAKTRMEQTVHMPDAKKYSGVDPYREPIQ